MTTSTENNEEIEGKAQHYYSPCEYFELEDAAEYKSEYHQGKILPVALDSANHNLIVGNLITHFHCALKEQSDYRLRDIDFTSPTYPNGNPRPDHLPPPHQHRWILNPTGGSPTRSRNPEPL